MKSVNNNSKIVDRCDGCPHQASGILQVLGRHLLDAEGPGQQCCGIGGKRQLPRVRPIKELFHQSVLSADSKDRGQRHEWIWPDSTAAPPLVLLTFSSKTTAVSRPGAMLRRSRQAALLSSTSLLLITYESSSWGEEEGIKWTLVSPGC